MPASTLVAHAAAPRRIARTLSRPKPDPPATEEPISLAAWIMRAAPGSPRGVVQLTSSAVGRRRFMKMPRSPAGMLPSTV